MSLRIQSGFYVEKKKVMLRNSGAPSSAENIVYEFQTSGYLFIDVWVIQIIFNDLKANKQPTKSLLKKIGWKVWQQEKNLCNELKSVFAVDVV